MLSSKAFELCRKLEDNTSNYGSELLACDSPSPFGIDREQNVTYEKFFLEYMLKNKPCLLVQEVTSNWKSRAEWVTFDGKPDFMYLSKNFGEAVIPVADCESWEYDAQKKQDMLFSEYIDYWLSLEDCQENHRCLYLKDWHFNRAYPAYKAYETPEFFTSDWLNEYCEHETDDYQFIYMGPKGTWTPLHADVFGSYSWSANVCGRKKWMLFPPGTEKQMHKFIKKGLYQLDAHCSSLGIEIIQNPGEVIFVPSGWYHQVWNLDDVISINHNWFNGCNINHIWKCLTLAADNVRQELADIKDADGWEEQCQVVLKLHHGMNYSDFLRLLCFVTKSRLEQLKCGADYINYWHWIFDLMSIKNVLSVMINFNLSTNTHVGAESELEKITNYFHSSELL